MEEQSHRDLESRYAELQGRLAAEQWVEAIAVAYRILAVDASFRDVDELLEGAKRGLGAAEERVEAGKEGASALAVEVEVPRGRSWRWLLRGAKLGRGGILLVGLLVILSLWARGVLDLPVLPSRRRVAPTAIAQAPSGIGSGREPTTRSAVEVYVSEKGHFSLEYPAGWDIAETDDPVNAIVFREPGGGFGSLFMVIFGQGQGQSAEQIWHETLGLIRFAREEETTAWWISEAESLLVDGHRARIVSFAYIQTEGELQRLGYAVGVVHGDTDGGINYALVGEATAEVWEERAPLLVAMVESVKFR